MAITFNEIPPQTLTPFMWVEIGERQNYDSLSTSIRALLVGASPNTKNAGKIQKILNGEEAKKNYGENSELYKMANYFFKNTSGHAVYCLEYDPKITNPKSTPFEEALATIGDEVFHVVASPRNDDTNIGKAKTIFEERFKAMEMLGGVYLTVVSGSYDELEAIGKRNHNSKNICLVSGALTDGTKPINETENIIGAVVGNIVQSASSDPAIPFQFLELKGIQARPIEKRLNRSQRQSLLEDGVSTLKEGNSVTIETLVTTYQKTENGVEDKRWKLLNKVLLASYIRADLTNYFTAKYGRAKLGVDGRNYAPNQSIMTPAVGKGELLSKLREYEYRGFVENVDGLVDKIFVEKDGDVLKFSTEVDLMDQLKVVMGKILI